jgi:integrase/recombinase XerD
VGRGKDILTIDRAAIQGYIEYLRLERHVTLKTVKMHLTALSSLYEFLVFDGRMDSNPILPIRRRYSRRYKGGSEAQSKKLISVEDMGKLINSEMNLRNKAIITLLAKTGIRRNELITLDVSDMNLIENKIKLKATGKRTNRIVFFDDEAAQILRRWLKIREGLNRRKETGLFISQWGNRISRTDVYDAVTRAAARVGLHNPDSKQTEDHFGPHCCRHWFCTQLFRNDMRTEYIKELRGDSHMDAFDSYNHIDLEELKEAYLACIPQLGI